MKAIRNNQSEHYRREPNEAFSQSRSVTNLYEPHTLIRQEGDPSDSIFFVESGFLTLSKTSSSGRRQILNFIFPGEYCCLTRREIYTYDIESLSFSSIRSIDKDEFNSVLDRSPNTMKQIHEQMVMWMDGLDELIFLLGTKSSATRTASFLIYLHIRQMRYLINPKYNEIPLSRSDIGDFLGMRVETVSRTLSKLKELKVIESYDNNRIKILDFGELCQLAEMDNHCPYHNPKTGKKDCSACMGRELRIIDQNKT